MAPVSPVAPTMSQLAVSPSFSTARLPFCNIAAIVEATKLSVLQFHLHVLLAQSVPHKLTAKLAQTDHKLTAKLAQTDHKPPAELA